MKKTKLKKIIQETESELERETGQIILNETEEYPLENFFNDLFKHGCQSGMVTKMIYYKDTYPFAKRHIEEILELKQELEQDLGQPFKQSNDLNWLAWFGFEETARRLYQQLGGKEW